MFCVKYWYTMITNSAKVWIKTKLFLNKWFFSCFLHQKLYIQGINSWLYWLWVGLELWGRGVVPSASLFLLYWKTIRELDCMGVQGGYRMQVFSGMGESWEE